jgi:hypothetical protein
VNPWTVTWVTWLARDAVLSEQTRWVIDRHLARLRALAADIQAAEVRLARVTADDPLVQTLQGLSEPGGEGLADGVVTLGTPFLHVDDLPDRVDVLAVPVVAEQGEDQTELLPPEEGLVSGPDPLRDGLLAFCYPVEQADGELVLEVALVGEHHRPVGLDDDVQ